MSDVATRQLAEFIWRERGCLPNSRDTDWQSAEWLCGKLRPFLTVAATTQTAQLIAELKGSAARSVRSSVATMIVVQDGAVEYAHTRLDDAQKASPNNGVHPEYESCAKTDDFYVTCHDYLSYRGFVINEPSGFQLNGQAVADTGQASRALLRARRFEDACVGMIEDSLDIHHTLAAAIGLVRKFAHRNEEMARSWTDRSHPRIGIGRTVEAAVSAIQQAWRSDVVVDPTILLELSRDCRVFALAAGIRFGSK